MAISQELVDRQGRLARNQALFREVNERFNHVNERWGDRPPMDEWVCECANERCTERIPLTPTEYEQIRGTPTHFPVMPLDSHVFLDVERVVQRNDRYWVVEKVEHGAAVSERFDPRARSSPGE